MTQQEALDILRTIDDPEMPISIVDLGIVERVRASGCVEVDLLPTFVGCPALDVLREMITRRLTAAGAAQVQVNFVYQPAWTVDRISEAGRERLRAFGIATPGRCSSGASPAAGVEGGLVALGRSGVQPPGSADGTVPDIDPTLLYGRAGVTPVACPLCGSLNTALQSPFGPTRCKAIYHCNACLNPFELLKRL